MPKPPLSTRPAQIRIRARRAAKAGSRDAEMYVEHVYRKPLHEWDLEELARGRPRDVNGHFTGSAPSWITPLVMKEAKRRLLNETFAQMASHVSLAVKTVVKLLKDTTVDDKGRPIVDARTKLEAAKFLIEHIVGKPKMLIESGSDSEVKAFLADALVMSDDDLDAAHPVIDGQFYEDDEEEDDDE